MKKIRKALANPFLLSAQGFALGALLFWSGQSPYADTSAASPSADASLLEAARVQL